MRYLYSPLQKQEYLTAMKERLESPFLIFDERVTGVVIGPFFSIAYYAPWEWNRRITSECNRAFGFVKFADGETEVAFIRSKGLLCLSWFLAIILFSVLCVLFVYGGDETENLVPVAVGMGVAIAAIVCGVTALSACMTEQGEAGVREVNRFLTNPKEYY